MVGRVGGNSHVANDTPEGIASHNSKNMSLETASSSSNSGSNVDASKSSILSGAGGGAAATAAAVALPSVLSMAAPPLMNALGGLMGRKEQQPAAGGQPTPITQPSSLNQLPMGSVQGLSMQSPSPPSQAQQMQQRSQSMVGNGGSASPFSLNFSSGSNDMAAKFLSTPSPQMSSNKTTWDTGKNPTGGLMGSGASITGGMSSMGGMGMSPIGGMGMSPIGGMGLMPFI